MVQHGRHLELRSAPAWSTESLPQTERGLLRVTGGSEWTSQALSAYIPPGSWGALASGAFGEGGLCAARLSWTL